MFAVFTAPSWRRRRSLVEQGGDGGDDGSGGGEEGRAEMVRRQNQEPSSKWRKALRAMRGLLLE